jgi:rhodanese-related sulfurtransferase
MAAVRRAEPEPTDRSAGHSVAHDALHRLATAQDVCIRFRHANPDVSHLTAEELKEMLRGDSTIVLVDVRSEGEYRVSTIPGSIRLAGVAEKAEQGATLVCFCTVGMRSSLEARILASRYPNCKVFSMDGVLTWSHAGGELCDPETGQPTNKLHVFSRKFSRMLPKEAEAEAVWYSTSSLGMVGALCNVGEKLIRSALHRLRHRYRQS